jgi:hypothetical protein
MGVSVSSSSPRGDTDVTHGIYQSSKYLWTPGQIAKNIQSGVVSPTFVPQTDRTFDHSCMCLVCYHWFPSINETNCCQHAICTECLACIVKPPPDDRVCPFCRRTNFEIRPNLGVRELTHYESGDQASPLVIDESRPDDFNALLLQFPAINPEEAWSLYQAGISVEEIANSIGQSGS